MSYSNIFLRDFKPIFTEILKVKGIKPERVELEVIDEEPEDFCAFEPADAKDVLEQLAADLNFLSIYTERPAYFKEFAETMYEENGLIVTIFSKKNLMKGTDYRLKGYRGSEFAKGRGKAICQKLMLDFEWEGRSYEGQMGRGRHYIPIHKKPWEIAENLDIMVPIGYNTVIVKKAQTIEEQQERDRFEAAFYEE